MPCASLIEAGTPVRTISLHGQFLVKIDIRVNIIAFLRLNHRRRQMELRSINVLTAWILFFSDQQQTVPDRNQHIVYTLILLYPFIKRLDSFRILAGNGLFKYLSVEQYIIVRQYDSLLVLPAAIPARNSRYIQSYRHR